MSMSRVPGSMSPTVAVFFVSPIIYLGEILALRRVACQKVRPPSLVASLTSFGEGRQLGKRLDQEFGDGMDESQRRGVRDGRSAGGDSQSGPAENRPASSRRCGIREETFDARRDFAAVDEGA